MGAAEWIRVGLTNVLQEPLLGVFTRNNNHVKAITNTNLASALRLSGQWTSRPSRSGAWNVGRNPQMKAERNRNRNRNQWQAWFRLEGSGQSLLNTPSAQALDGSHSTLPIAHSAEGPGGLHHREATRAL